MIKTLLIPSLYMAALWVSPASADSKTQDQRRAAQEVYVSAGDEPPSLDPTKQVDSVSYFWLGHIFEGLTTIGKSGEIVPGAAEKIDVSADGKTYTFKMRRNAVWQDGKPVTAHDFEFAFKRLVDPVFASEYSFIAETAQIENATEIINSKAPLTSLGVRATSDDVLVVKLKNPVAFFPSLMRFQAFFPVRADLVKKYGDRFSQVVESVVGNGPFVLAEWKKESSMRLEKSKTYWNEKAITLTAIAAPVLLKDVGAQYNVFRTGGIDIANLDAERLKLAGREKLAIKSFLDGSVYYLRPNHREGRPFANAKLRKALQLGMARNEYVNKISGIPGDKPAFGFVPDYMPGSKTGLTFRKEQPLAWKDADIAGAKKLIAEYLAETKQTQVPPFTIVASDTNTAKRDAEYFQSKFSALFNTKVSVDSVPFKTRLQKQRDGDYDLMTTNWGPDYLDATTFLDLFYSQKSSDPKSWGDARYDELIVKARNTTNLKDRTQFLGDAEKVLLESGIVLPFLQRGRAYISADGLQGVVRSQVGQDPDLRFARWNTASAKK